MSVREFRCLVTGATGYIGGRLAPLLLDKGLTVRALARNPDKLSNLPWHDRAEVVRGDLGDPESLTAAFRGVDVVYYLVHSMGTSRDFETEEGRSARTMPTFRHTFGHEPRSERFFLTPASKPWCCKPGSSSEQVRRRSR
jgi:NAD(P)-dependent dehydrogenase (short-subunit alcohol dehydrogenase family)